ncbi:MAG: cysteine desulfurase family protein [Catonella sp.]|uniref:cysteine desulfurase family protein n=1 Tax=Catonella sp. TaxID=2382125 RepID=UPI003FA0D5AF
MECYLDNAATTRPFDSVIEIMNETMRNAYANPSSKHIKGFEAERFVEDAKEKIAKTLKAKKSEIIFTSCGTESNNQAILMGAATKKRYGNKIVTTCFEHASVYKSMEVLAKEGYKITYLPVNKLGHVRDEDLVKSIDDETIMLSFMLVNNEIGALADAEHIIKLAKEKNPNILIHIDAIQGYGKFEINTKKLQADFISVSGHKFHAPKGIGFLYVREGIRITPYIHGGGQQKNLRSGTLNVPGIAGIGAAAETVYDNHKEKINKLYNIKEKFIRDLLANFPDCTINGVDTTGDLSANILKTAPQIVSVSFRGIKAEVLLHALEEKGIYVSSGSACSSHHPDYSGTLKGIGLDDDLLDSTLRFSFGMFTEPKMTDYAIEMLKELIPTLSKYRRK